MLQDPFLYHAHHNLRAEDLPFWLELAIVFGDPMLELGCGTGRVLIPLARAGHRIWGLDRDFNMLSFLGRQLDNELQQRVSLIQADFAWMPLEEHFQLVIMPCNTFSTLSSALRWKTLISVHRCLHAEGVFVASMPNPYLLKQLPTHAEPELEDVFYHPLDGEPVQVSSGWERSEDLFRLFLHYDHLRPDGNVERTSVQVSHFITPTHVYRRELSRAGFENIEAYGDYDRSKLRRTSPHLILLAIKRQIKAESSARRARG